MNGTEEEFVPEEEAEEGPALVKKLREKLKKAVEEKQEYLEGWQRARADFANFKREEAALQSAKEERAVASVVESLIPALDSLEMAQRHSASPELSAVYKQLLRALKELGVEQYGKPEETFDPYKYEALREVPTENASFNNMVEAVERSGYSIGDRIIRPAQVSVYSLK